MPIYNPVSSSGSGGISIGDIVTSATDGSILFVGASSVLAQDNANLFWDPTPHTLYLGAAHSSVNSLKTKLYVQQGTADDYAMILRGRTATATNWLLMTRGNDEYPVMKFYLNSGIPTWYTDPGFGGGTIESDTFEVKKATDGANWLRFVGSAVYTDSVNGQYVQMGAGGALASSGTAIIFTARQIPDRIALVGKQVSITGIDPTLIPVPIGSVDVVSNSTTLPTLVTRGKASQTADLKQWLDSSNNVLASVDIKGHFALRAGSSSTLAKVGGCIFDHFVDVGNGTTVETDLYSDTIPTSALAVNGDKLNAEYGGVFVSSGTATRQVKIYFGGTAIFDTGALTLSLSSAWTAYVSIIRVSSTVIRYMISLATEGAALSAYTAVGELTSLTLDNTNILKITGTAAGVGAASNDIVAKLGTVRWDSAA